MLQDLKLHNTFILYCSSIVYLIYCCSFLTTNLPGKKENLEELFLLFADIFNQTLNAKLTAEISSFKQIIIGKRDYPV